MYLRDPAGNLVEVTWPDVESLTAETRAQIQGLEELGYAQDETQRGATLYTEPAATSS
jgi:hypothetical protein